MFRLDGKVALITGAAGGLGRGIARAFAQAGASVVLNDLTDEGLAGFSRDLEDYGVGVTTILADVRHEEAVDRLFDRTVAAYGRLDILVNNVGTSRPQTILETSLADWQAILDTNLTSTFLCSRRAFALMQKQAYGRIITISSVVGEQGALYGHVHYAASKSAQLGFVKTLARTAAPHNVTVNAIAPGIIATPLLYRTHGEDGVARLSQSVPLGLGRVEDVGATALFLASDEARYITGATIDVNGGLLFR